MLQILKAHIQQKALCQPAGTCPSCKGWEEEGAGLCAPGVPAESKATNGNNHQGMIFHALIPITDLSSKKNTKGEISLPFKPNVPHRSQSLWKQS